MAIRQQRRSWRFRDQVIACTEAGEHVLVYAPQALINTDTHMRYDASGRDDPVTVWDGRTIYWQHFGSGRGTNAYKDCTVFFQLRAFARNAWRHIEHWQRVLNALPEHLRHPNV